MEDTEKTKYILSELQDRYKELKVAFIDECSMLLQNDPFFFSQRLKQIKGNQTLFGGSVVVLTGDTGQLPAVRGRVLWDRKLTRLATAIGGPKLYLEFKTVVTLTWNVRIQPDGVDATYYDDFLTRLRDSNCDKADYNRIWATCSKMFMGMLHGKEEVLLADPSVTELYATNWEVDERNAIRFRALQKPISKLQAINSCPQARTLTNSMV
jgi:hypothetical protein